MKKFADDNDQFERTFADLAFASLREKSPKLLDYLVGFQIINKDDEGTHASGVFGFNVDGAWYYAPVFFINGELKGSELLYIKEKDTFIPLQENWVNYIINRKTQEMGQGIPEKERELGIVNPEFSSWVNSPLSRTKVGMFEGTARENTGYWVRGFAFDFRPALSPLAVSPNSEVFKKSAAKTALPTVLPDFGQKGAAVLKRMSMKHSKIASAIKTFYGADYPQVIAELAVGKVEKKAEVETPVSYRENVEFIKTSDTTELTDDERSELLSDGIVIRDHREKTAEVYPASLNASLTNPGASGVYNILIKPAKFKKCVVIYPTSTIGKGASNVAAVIDESTKDFMLVRPSSVFASDAGDTTTFAKYFAGLSSVDSMETGKSYVIVSENGSGSIPFTVKKITEEDGSKTLMVRTNGYPSSSKPYSSNDRAFVDHDYDSVDMGDFELWGVRCITLSDVLNGMKAVGDTLLVGKKSCKVISVNDNSKNFAFGDISDIEASLFKAANYQPLTIFSNGSRYQLKDPVQLTRSLTFPQAAEQLVSRFNIKAAQAKKMLKKSDQSSVERFLVKMALPSLQEGEYGPDLSAMSGSQQYDPNIRAMVEQGMASNQPVPGMEMGQRGQGGPSIDDNIMNLATNAAQTGQKEVFDTATLAGLVKAVDVGALVDKYLGDLVLGEDRVGRTLFLFYWHHDKFVDRYGEEEMSELEDSLKNTFKGLGDLVLFLKKTSALPDPALAGGDVNIGADQ